MALPITNKAGADAALGRNAQADAWIERVLKLQFPPAPQRTSSDGMAAWQAARTAAIATLKAVEQAVARSTYPQRDRAVILLRAIRANLTERPETPQQQAELERYLTKDDIIAAAEQPNVFGIAVSLRDPLLAALSVLRAG